MYNGNIMEMVNLVLEKKKLWKYCGNGKRFECVRILKNCFKGFLFNDFNN